MGVLFCRTILNMENEIEKTQFLLDNRKTIIDGLDYIDANVFHPNFLTALEQLSWRCVIVPDEEWTVGKVMPTESSKEDGEVGVLNSYLKRNPRMFGYGDRYGWAWHELVHAAIFSGRFPSRFIEQLDSQFEYPLNTDEIYCYGYQMRHLAESRQMGSLIRFALGKVPSIKPDLCLLSKSLFS